MIKNKYNHIDIEKGKYDIWLEKNLFKSGNLDKEPFCMVIPPPNVTGKLHLGHAWNTTIQDVIIRYKRMKGFDALWLPGMDHAGIATQSKVDERLKNNGINPRSMNREEWLKQAWDWKAEYADIIRKQWAKLGLSLDYSKEKFTMDDDINLAVNEVFVKLYQKGLIYRGERIINFDPIAMTALSNIEVIYKEEKGILYYLKYKIEGTNDYLTVATTRPETIFGDTALAVNPKDSRYNHLMGKRAIIPAVNKPIPIVLDDYADMEFGTGIVKITPAHDPNDFEVGNRHNLERIICINPNGKMNAQALEYEGLDRFECRNKLIKDLETQELLIKTKEIKHSIGYSERTNVIIEPYLSKQWFVKMDVLAKRSLEFQQDKMDNIKFIPKRFETIFINWMNNIQDWCISRQLWWGHRIPAWYKGEDIYVGIDPPKDQGWIQDDDVLDTWFSSALWPFTTLGWPKELDDRYFPNDVLVTGYDIIFFWVSRMIFQSLEFTDKKPFNDILIHGLIRDNEGRKMSKSLGNGVDPMDVIDQYGADALRFFLTTTSSPGQDLRYDEEKIKSAWNFINKLWNASRYVLINIDESTSNELNESKLSIYDKWILKRLNDTIKTTEKFMDKYEFNVVGTTLYAFIWNDFCHWYIELSKFRVNDDETKPVLKYVLDNILRMLHPFMPFVTEEIFQTLSKESTSITITQYPLYNKKLDYEEETNMAIKIMDMIAKIRNVKQENNIKNNFLIAFDFNENELEIINTHKELIIKMLKANIVDKIADNYKKIEITLSYGTIIIGFESDIVLDKNINDLKQQKEMLLNNIKRRTALLANPKYLTQAPKEIVADEESKLKDEQEKIILIEAKINKKTK